MPFSTYEMKAYFKLYRKRVQEDAKYIENIINIVIDPERDSDILPFYKEKLSFYEGELKILNDIIEWLEDK